MGFVNKHRTESQIEADAIDMELDRLVRRAMRFSEKEKDARWKRAYRAIDSARSSVRLMMHTDDVQSIS